MFKLIGFLFVLLIAVAGGWYLKGRWDARGQVDTATVEGWQPITAEGAARAASGISRLARDRDGAYVSLTPADFAAHVLIREARVLPPTAHDARASIEEGRFVMRAMVKTSELGDVGILGPVARLLRENEEVRVAGTFQMVREGLAEFRISEGRIRGVALPAVIVSRVIRLLGGPEKQDGVSSNALPFTVPSYVADIRIAEEMVLVYRRKG